MIHRCRRHPLWFNLDGDGLKRPLPGKIHDVLSESGRKQQRLPIFLAGCSAHNALNLRNKPHVQHTIRLVEDKRFHPIQCQVAPLHEVDQAAGGRNDEINGRLIYLAQLFLIIRTTDEGHRFQTREPAQFGCVSGNLHHQLTSRRNDHSARLTKVTLPLDRVV